jgi:hypothetical protein
MAKPSLEDYIEVPERIQRFYAQYPDGSLQGTWEVVEVAGDTLIVYTARAYRSSQDPTPGVGTASEPYPGKTSFTKGSELMNAETSAWGRAIVSLGFLAKDEKVASKEEVKGAQARNVADEVKALPGTTELATKTQLTKLTKAKEALGVTRFDAYLTAQGVDKPEELTKDAAESVLTWARNQAKKQVAA